MAREVRTDHAGNSSEAAVSGPGFGLFPPVALIQANGDAESYKADNGSSVISRDPCYESPSQARLFVQSQLTATEILYSGHRNLELDIVSARSIMQPMDPFYVC